MAAAATYPPWVIFDEDCTLEVQGSSSSIADTNTLARCRTRTGHLIEVSLCLAAPPEGSRVCVHLPPGIVASDAKVIAAHGDSVLVMVDTINNGGTEHFVYSAGNAAAEPPRPPSLSLLAPRPFTFEENKRRPECSNYLYSASTGLLRRADGDFLVAELMMVRVKESDGTVHDEAELHLLRSVSCKWCVKQPVITSSHADAGEFVDDYLVSSWRNDMVIPVGDQMLCWVDSARGLLFSNNLFDERPSLQYVPFNMADYCSPRGVFATADGSMIKVVNAFPHCCCGGGAGKSKHRASHIHTWTMRMDDVNMAWVMDGSLDSDQLWALDGYKGIPRVELKSPVVCMDEPEAICFVVREGHQDFHGDETKWRIIVDMKNKTLRSIFRSPRPEGQRFNSYYSDRYLPSRVSKYFNAKPSTGQPPGLAAQAEAMQNPMNSRIKNKRKAIDDPKQLVASPETAILATLQEIPSLNRDDLMKVYGILTHDDSGRRFRSLIGLPVDLRKDWVLMEIKVSEACVLCSACSADMEIKE